MPGGYAHCFCDKKRFPLCPGHGPTGLKGIKCRTKPVGSSVQQEKAIRWTKALRPTLSDADAERHAFSSKRWAFTCWHLPNNGQGDEVIPAMTLGGHGRNSLGSPILAPRATAQEPAAARAPPVAQARPIPSAPRLVKPISRLPSPNGELPARGWRLAVQEGDVWVGGVVTQVEQALSDITNAMATSIHVQYDDGTARPPLSPDGGFRVVRAPATPSPTGQENQPMAGNKRVPGGTGSAPPPHPPEVHLVGPAPARSAAARTTCPIRSLFQGHRRLH